MLKFGHVRGRFAPAFRRSVDLDAAWRRLAGIESRRLVADLNAGRDGLIMTNATIARPEWTTIIDPVLQKELEQHVLVTTWDKLLGIVDTVYNWGRRSA